MKIKYSVYTLFFFLVFSGNSFGQIPIERQILDSNNEPVPYVNVGVLGTTNGTVSDDDGWFRLTIKDPNKDDVFVISAIGFKRLEMSTQEAVTTQGPFILEAVVYELGEIVVRPKKLKKKKYGQLKGSKNIFRATVNKRGYEEAILVKPKKYPFKVKSASLRIDASRLKSSSFRIRFYASDPETEAPGEELTEKNYILTSTKKKGEIKLDLDDDGIWFDTPVYVSFEWLINKENEAITFALLDSIKTIRNSLPPSTDTTSTSTSYSFVDGKPQEGVVVTDRIKGVLEISRLSNAIPVAYYVISRRPKVKSYARSIFLEEWKRNEQSVVGFLEVLHE